ncbi:MAG: hypothetical protein ABIH59_03105 [archaeon]
MTDESNIGNVEGNRNLPVLTMCSYCKKVKDPNSGKFIGESDPLYKSLLEEYRDRISHGACDPYGEDVKEGLRQYKKSRLAGN